MNSPVQNQENIKKLAKTIVGYQQAVHNLRIARGEISPNAKLMIVSDCDCTITDVHTAHEEKELVKKLTNGKITENEAKSLFANFELTKALLTEYKDQGVKFSIATKQKAEIIETLIKKSGLSGLVTDGIRGSILSEDPEKATGGDKYSAAILSVLRNNPKAVSAAEKTALEKAITQKTQTSISARKNYYRKPRQSRGKFFYNAQERETINSAMQTINGILGKYPTFFAGLVNYDDNEPEAMNAITQKGGITFGSHNDSFPAVNHSNHNKVARKKRGLNYDNMIGIAEKLKQEYLTLAQQNRLPENQQNELKQLNEQYDIDVNVLSQNLDSLSEKAKNLGPKTQRVLSVARDINDKNITTVCEYINLRLSRNIGIEHENNKRDLKYLERVVKFKQSLSPDQKSAITATFDKAILAEYKPSPEVDDKLRSFRQQINQTGFEPSAAAGVGSKLPPSNKEVTPQSADGTNIINNLNSKQNLESLKSFLFKASQIQGSKVKRISKDSFSFGQESDSDYRVYRFGTVTNSKTQKTFDGVYVSGKGVPENSYLLPEALEDRKVKLATQILVATQNVKQEQNGKISTNDSNSKLLYKIVGNQGAKKIIAYNPNTNNKNDKDEITPESLLEEIQQSQGRAISSKATNKAPQNANIQARNADVASPQKQQEFLQFLEQASKLDNSIVINHSKDNNTEFEFVNEKNPRENRIYRRAENKNGQYEILSVNEEKNTAKPLIDDGFKAKSTEIIKKLLESNCTSHEPAQGNGRKGTNYWLKNDILIQLCEGELYKRTPGSNDQWHSEDLNPQEALKEIEQIKEQTKTTNKGSTKGQDSQNQTKKFLQQILNRGPKSAKQSEANVHTR